MAHGPTRRPRLAALTVAALVATAGCSAPGSDSGTSGSNASAAPVTSATCGTAPVTLKGYFETGFALPKNLADEFTKQFPNVK